MLHISIIYKYIIMQDKLFGLITQQDYQNISESDWPDFSEILTDPSSIPVSIHMKLKKMLEQTQHDREKSSKFCSLAFHGREYRLTGIRSGLRCCQTDIKNLSSIQNQLLHQQEPANCKSRCFDLERAGISTLRTIHNSTLDWLLDRDIANLYKDCEDRDGHPIYMYKIETSNICNGLCVTCGSKFSTAWQQLERKNGVQPYPLQNYRVNDKGLSFDIDYDDTQTILPIDYDNAKFINFFGGESTINNQNFDILERLLAHNNQDCFVSFTTHGNFILSPEQWKILSRFPSLHFNFSIDGIEKKFEYLRYPFSWAKIQENIEWCRSKNIQISVNCTLSNLNIFYFDEIKDWFEKTHINFHFNPANNHKTDMSSRTYHITSLSSRVKNIIIEKNKSPEIKNLITKKFHTNDDDKFYRDFLLDICKQDQWKGISLQEYLPEFYDVIKKDIQEIKHSKFIPINKKTS